MSRRIARTKIRRAGLAKEEEEELDPSETSNYVLIPSTSPHSLEPNSVIDLFKASFARILASEDLEAQIQVVKGDLYNRDYAAAFNCDDKRFAYASRWTPARSLSYTSLFGSLPPIKELFAEESKNINTLCVGGGAGGELVALGALFAKQKGLNGSTSTTVNVDLIDIADWASVVSHLTTYMKSKWYYNPDVFSTRFIHDDILSTEALDYSDYDLVTLLFTTNELFSAQRRESVAFLSSLNKSCKPGAYLLIAESAGSYSHITIGSKKFPIQFLVDTILVGKPGSEGDWELVDESDSCWYRINPKEVTYHTKLENMRFFYRLYRKL